MCIHSNQRLPSQSDRGRQQDEAFGAVHGCTSAVLSVLGFMASCVHIHTLRV